MNPSLDENQSKPVVSDSNSIIQRALHVYLAVYLISFYVYLCQYVLSQTHYPISNKEVWLRPSRAVPGAASVVSGTASA